MTIPPEFRQAAGEFPPVLRALLEAELAAGNQILEVSHCFPAPPAGAAFLLARQVTTRPRASGDGLDFRACNSSLYSGWFTDDCRFYFLVEPPMPPEPEPDMDAIRAAQTDPHTALGRFQRSMVVDYEKWHDGVGYDSAALPSATAAEREAIETLLLARGIQDWRDVEALAALGTPPANRLLRAALDSPNAEISMAVARSAPQLVSDAERAAALVKALRTADFDHGLSHALDEAAEFHPPEVIDALFRGCLARDGECAFLFAAMLFYLHGQAADPLAWDQRPFLLRLNTADPQERRAVFLDLCQKLSVDAAPYL